MVNETQIFATVAAVAGALMTTAGAVLGPIALDYYHEIRDRRRTKCITVVNHSDYRIAVAFSCIKHSVPCSVQACFVPPHEERLIYVTVSSKSTYSIHYGDERERDVSKPICVNNGYHNFTCVTVTSSLGVIYEDLN